MFWITESNGDTGNVDFFFGDLMLLYVLYYMSYVL